MHLVRCLETMVALGPNQAREAISPDPQINTINSEKNKIFTKNLLIC